MLSLDELQLLLEKATPGPWESHAPHGWLDSNWPDDRLIYRNGGRDSEHQITPGGGEHGDYGMNPADAALIVALRNAAPSLIAAARKVESEGASEGASAWSHTGGSSVDEDRPDHCIECSEAAGEWVAWPCSPEALVKAAVEIDRFHRSADFDSEVERELARRIASMHGRQFVCTRGHVHIAGTATEDHVCRLDETGGED